MKVSPSIEKLVPYVPGKPIEETKRELGLDTVIKLASNENPLGTSAKVKEALMGALDSVFRYPDASCFELTQKISSRLQVPPDWLAFGNGSDELIDLITRTFCEPGDRVLMSEKSFAAYTIRAQSARAETQVFQMGEDLKIPAREIAQYLRKSRRPTDRVLFIANPNNPTGTYLNRDEMQEILSVAGGWDDFLIVIDEAYNEFVRASDYPDSLALVKNYSNVITLRTMGKVYGLAGLRLGYMVAQPKITQWVQRIRQPFNVNALAQVAAVAALDDGDYLKKSQEAVWSGLDYFYTELERFGLPFWKSQANFVLFDGLRSGREIFQALLKKGVIMRPLANYGLPRHLRLSVGLKEENEAAMRALENVLATVPEGSGV